MAPTHPLDLTLPTHPLDLTLLIFRAVKTTVAAITDPHLDLSLLFSTYLLDLSPPPLSYSQNHRHSRLDQFLQGSVFLFSTQRSEDEGEG